MGKQQQPTHQPLTIQRKTACGLIIPLQVILVTLMVSIYPQSGRAATMFGANNGGFTDVGPPSVTALPVPRTAGDAVFEGEWARDDKNNKLTVSQDQDKALFEWETFDIGENAWTHFDQQGEAGWVALNRIYDANPSQIMGRLTADGKVYLINQNGILFGENARVNVHSLIAASLNMPDSGALNFFADDYREEGDDTVLRWTEDENGDEVPLPGPVFNAAGSNNIPDTGIYTDNAGSVFLIAPNVENQGIIEAPYGQIGLAAGRRVEIAALSQGRSLPHVLVNDYDEGVPLLADPALVGMALNGTAGFMAADSGVAGMYGRAVRQEGLIRSVTAVKKGGTIELHARDSVHLATGSITACPITDDSEAFHQSFEGEQGAIHISGLGSKGVGAQMTWYEDFPTGHIVHQGDILAPGGAVTLTAAEQVYLDSGSRIDVSGKWAHLSADDAVVEMQLNSLELKNDYYQQDGTLAGEDIQIIGYAGSTIGDLSGALNAESRSALEMNTKGGTVIIGGLANSASNLQEIIVREGALLDISGGGNVYSEGHYRGTQLLAGNRIYDISEAPEWLQYDRVLGHHQVANDRYGLIDEFFGFFMGGANPVNDFLSSHVEGHDAGALTLKARGILFNGTLIGSAMAGFYQTDLAIAEEQFGDYFLEALKGTRMPRGGRLTIGLEEGISIKGTGPSETINYLTDEVMIAADNTPLPEKFQPGDDMRGAAWETLTASPFHLSDGETVSETPLYRSMISADMLNRSGLSDFRIYANTRVTIAQDASLTLSPGGYLLNEDANYQPSWPVAYDTKFGDHPATLTIRAGAFENRGGVDMPAGRVDVQLIDTPWVNGWTETRLATPLQHRALLADGSRISVAGDRIDNLDADIHGDYETGFINGGDITIANSSYYGGDIVVQSGAVLDVSAGYERDGEGDLTAGSAGRLSLKANSLVLEGALRGYGLAGNDGGRIELHSGWVTVAETSRPVLPLDFAFDDSLPEDWRNQETGYAGLVLAEDRLADTGFTAIDLKSFEDLTFENGIHFTPSDVRLAPPDAPDTRETGLPGYYAAGGQTDNTLLAQGLVRVGPQYQGRKSRISAMAGKAVSGLQSGTVENFDNLSEEELPHVMLPANTVLETAPGGEIEVAAPGSLTLEGGLCAPGGDVRLSATGQQAEVKVTLAPDSWIDAGGTTLPTTSALETGLPVNHTLLDGGTVTLSAANGSVDIMETAAVDVSGSGTITNYVRGAAGVPVADTMSSHGGGISVTFKNDCRLDGTIAGHASSPDAHGASLSLSRRENPLTVEKQLIDAFQEKGFDGFGFASERDILFAEPMTVDAGRFLILDAPLVSGTASLPEGSRINLTAAHVTLANTADKFGNIEALDDKVIMEGSELLLGTGQLRLAGTWVDLKGAVAVQGFHKVTLDAGRDMRVLDARYDGEYNGEQKELWHGGLRVPGALTLDAARIYPAMKAQTVTATGSSVEGTTYLTPSAFKIQSDAGRIAIESRGKNPDGPVYSAGGVLAITAPEIHHNGHLAAPMGQIALVTNPPVEVDGEALPARDVAIISENGQYTVSITSNIQDGALPGDRIVLGGSSVTTTGSETAVQYGLLQGETWQMPDKIQVPHNPVNMAAWPEVRTAPARGIYVQGTDLSIAGGAVLNSNAGGSVYAAQFMPGIRGLANPLEKDGRHVIVPGVSRPGDAVSVADAVTAVDGQTLAAGDYSLLPGRYAFLPGAFILEDRGNEIHLGETAMTEDGFPAVLGFESMNGTGFRDPGYRRYAVRSAGEVLREGEFSIAQALAGSPGTIAVKGRSVDLRGTLAMDALDHFPGGVLALSGRSIAVGRPTDAFEPDLQLDPALLAGLDLEDLRIGDETLPGRMGTEAVRLYEGTLQAPNVTLAAAGDVILNAGAAVRATGDALQITDFTLHYTYDADGGLDAFQLTDIAAVNGTGDISGTLTRQTADGALPLTFQTRDGTLQWQVSPQALAHVPDRFLAVTDAPYGTAALVAETGAITLNPGSRVHARDEVVLDGLLDLQGGVLSAENSALQLRGDAILFVPEGFQGNRSRGLYLTESLWNNLNSFESITVNSRTDLVFLGDHDIAAAERLTLDAQRIIGLAPAEFQDFYADDDNQSAVTLSGETVYLTNSRDVAAATDTLTLYQADGTDHTFAPLEDTGMLTVNAGACLFLDPGHIRVNGFETVNLTGDGSFVFRGEGTLETAQAAAVNMNAPSGLASAPYYLDTAGLAEKASGMTRGEIESFIDENLRVGVLTETNGQDRALADIRADVAEVIETLHLSAFDLTDYEVQAGQGAVTILGGGAEGGDATTAGGALAITGHTIDHHGAIDLPGGSVVMTALANTPDQGITLHDGSRVRARGGKLAYTVAGERQAYAYAGGSVGLTAETGRIVIEDGAVVDVSADAGQDAGSIVLSAPEYGVAINGTLSGASAAGKGGAFALYTDRLTETGLGSLGVHLYDQGFTQEIIVHTSFGDLTLAQNNTLAAHHIKLVADDRNDEGNGNITILGKLDAAGDATAYTDGGSVELFAWNDLTVGGTIDASSASGRGGEVYLSAGHDDNVPADETGMMVFDGIIDVGGMDADHNGDAHFRAYRSNDEDNMTLTGAIPGADRITAETAAVYSSFGAAAGHLDDDPADVDFTALANYVDYAADQLHARAGIEVRSSGGLALNSDWDLSGVLSSEGRPGILTIRAAGDLTFNDNLLDYYDPNNPTGDPFHSSWGLTGGVPRSIENSSNTPPQWVINSVAWTFNAENISDPDFPPLAEWAWQFNFDRLNPPNWEYTLVSGANLQSADITTTSNEDGDLNLGGQMIYTQNGKISFAAGGDVLIGDGSQASRMINPDLTCNLGTFSGSIRGKAGGSLTFNGRTGAIQSALGDIDLDIAGDLNINISDGNAIRTTGVYPQAVLSSTGNSEWLARHGGDIRLTVGNDIPAGEVPRLAIRDTSYGPALTYWGRFYTYENEKIRDGAWAADFGAEGTPTAGVATMGGGNVEVRAGGNVQGQFGTFKDGDLNITAGGDTGGLFQVGDDYGTVSAMGSINSGFEHSGKLQYATSLALLGGSADINAQGTISLGTIYNPTLAPSNVSYVDDDTIISQALTYSHETPSSVSLASVYGDVQMAGDYTSEGSQVRITNETYRVLPPKMSITAAGDILFENTKFALAPAAGGNLQLAAGRDITYMNQSGGPDRARLYIADLDPATVYGYEAGLTDADLDNTGYDTPEPIMAMFADHDKADAHAKGMVLHANDPDPVEIIAGRDIRELMLCSPKKLALTAGRNIQGLFLMVQHTTPLSMPTVPAVGVSPDSYLGSPLDTVPNTLADVTAVRAGGDILMASDINVIKEKYSGQNMTRHYRQSGFLFAGPGDFLVQAGNDIDLGVTRGILSVGDTFNAMLPKAQTAAGAGALAVVAGVFKEMAPSGVRSFFDTLRTDGRAFSALQADGDAAGAQALVDQTETETIMPFFSGGDTGQGNIYMTASQIASKGETSMAMLDTVAGDRGFYPCSSDLYIAARGSINVGQSAISRPGTGQSADTGIYTALGGDVNIFSMGNLNVNESRVMTFRGGDILAWSHAGDINAGRGARTAVNASPPVRKPVYKEDGGDYLYRCTDCEENDENLELTKDEWEKEGYTKSDLELVVDRYEIEFTPPAVGSGIRALTYDPDGVEGPKRAPVLGDAYLFAPSGIIDAGEAGIAARNVTLAAVEVLNVQNIEVSGVSVGVPTTTGGASLGALSGTSDVSDAGDMASQTSDMAAETAAEARKRMKELEKSLQDAFLGLDVKVVSFEDLDV
ncbi:MAG: filamentous hemagglutinin family protein [Thermodesulfobacteriota bacterium]|nr:filamentous hemagglutinin family protein [Thermodesulfobacteriota bacterium]